MISKTWCTRSQEQIEIFSSVTNTIEQLLQKALLLDPSEGLFKSFLNDFENLVYQKITSN